MNQSTQSYKDLIVWQKGIELAKAVYKLTMSFPAEEKFGLVSQMRRAAVSIPSNIAEGQARRTTPEFIQFVTHAQGSTAELDTQIILAVELQFCPKTDRKSTRLNSSHANISYAVFCLKKKKTRT